MGDPIEDIKLYEKKKRKLDWEQVLEQREQNDLKDTKKIVPPVDQKTQAVTCRIFNNRIGRS